ncbi:hypothetical protein [Lewinella sp. LCG006]|uniref:hypothetical protein n=1 Tax=Lewinella sp. LCG006 TaxID=3231911 RepID=UPI00345FB42C
MKTLQTLPQDKSFFDIYAGLAKSITSAGLFAQVVSGLTEIGIIYTGTKQALAPLHLGNWGLLLAVIVALVATATIEGGLRKTFPKAVDSVLYGRWHGLHLPISIFVWLLVIVLTATSGILSFRNSTVIVEDMTPEATEKTTATADSTYREAMALHRATFQQDSTMIETTYQGQATATATAYDGKINAKTEQLRGYESRERRTGNSYASSKDRVRQQRAELEAEKAAALATLATSKAEELAAIKATFRSSTQEATNTRNMATAEVKEENKQAEAERLATVNGYGGDLGWFTVVCLFLFSVSVVLDRIYQKGAGIEESVQIEAYDFRPGAFQEWWSAISERISYSLHSKITAFANSTPSAPLPAQPGAVYDLAEALQHVTIKLQLEQADEEEQRIVYLNAKEPEENTPPQRRQIGFQQHGDAENSCDLYSTRNTNDAHTKHEHETVDLREAKQRLKMYKKRLGSHQQKAIKQEENSGKVCRRTADAIANNKGWISHYETLITDLQNSAQ